LVHLAAVPFFFLAPPTVPLPLAVVAPPPLAVVVPLLVIVFFFLALAVVSAADVARLQLADIVEAIDC